MDAFDMISEPVLFVEQLRDYSTRVRQSVELIQSLADALLAEDYAMVETLREQMCKVRAEADESKLSLYGQIKGMHFHAVGGDAFNRYMACLDEVADALQGLADLLVSRKAPIPVELRDDFRALVAEVVNVGDSTISVAEGLLSEAPTACVDAETRNSLDITRGAIDDRGRTRQRVTEFTQHLYNLDRPLDTVTVLFLDRCRTTLHEVADSVAHAADCLRLMVR
jgi:predicted phosphate transport protein (TIGR00153 family)